ncbi:fibrillin-1-like [Amphibalanus amphitrite]|uniref:fibrillin-1-like n=1 Tax=Amphibalanus amphitrite TaxID=1232801 RepID=UPI001C919340|nr:fibrillin-1-like [Amphibalanus amphitrite]
MKPIRLAAALLLVTAVAAAGSDGPAATVGSEGASAAAESAEGGKRSGRFFSLFSRLFGYPAEKEVETPVVAAAPTVVQTVPHVQRVHRPIKISPVIVLKPEHPSPPQVVIKPQLPPPVVIKPHPAPVVVPEHPPPVVIPEPEYPPSVVIPEPCTGYGCPECDSHRPCLSGYCWTGQCVQCLFAGHCGAGYLCESQVCVPAPAPVPEPEYCGAERPCPHGFYCAHGHCKPYVLPGYPCEGPESCESNSCPHGTCAACSQWKPCPHGEFCSHGVCNPPGNTDDQCWFNLQCRSHICLKGQCAECAQRSDCPSGQYCRQGKCKTRGLFGDECSSPAECRSNNCDVNVGRCIDCRNSLQCSQLQYCSADNRCEDKRPFQFPCTKDYECVTDRCSRDRVCVFCSRSQHCDNEFEYCDLKEGDCKELLDFGRKCESTRECRRPLKCEDKKCVECTRNRDCPGSKNRCKDNRCVKKSGALDKCKDDSDCDSGVCDKDKCRQCRKGGGGPDNCPRGQRCNDDGVCQRFNVPENGACESGLDSQCQSGLVCTNLRCKKRKSPTG